MREEDLVYLAYLPMTLALYAVFAARDIPALAGRRVSERIAYVVQHALPARGREFTGSRIGRYLGWTAFTQVVPLLFALSNAATAIRVASAAEMLAAIGWTAYLLRSPSHDIPRR